MRIMIVDDDPSVIVLLKEFLRPSHEVFECSSGDQAIDFLNNTNIKFDLIICDNRMPNGSGVDVLKHLHSNNLDIRFILFTSNTDLIVPFPYKNFLGLYPKDDLDNLLNDIPTQF